MQRFLLRIMYDGTCFHGWQKQKGKRSVQEELERELHGLLGHRIVLTGSGRTDAGVHATAHYAHFDYSGKLNPKQMLSAMKTRLASDVAITGIWTVSSDFHARYSAFARSYVYLLAREENPLNRLYTGFMPKMKLYPERMAKLAEVLMGSHDFTSLSRDNPAVPKHICEITELAFSEKQGIIRIDITADRFLHNMVRRIVGTLVNLARNDLGQEVLQRILEEKHPRQKYVMPAPAQGLYLVGVSYHEISLDEPTSADLIYTDLRL
jgi:tRNA pseudouridine38-40 synthase